MKKFDRFCPCQSGLKASECCFTKKKITKEIHWASIKARVVKNFIAEHPTEGEVVKIQQWVGTSRMTEFEKGMEPDTLQLVLIDAYFFTYNTKEWGYFLIKMMKEIVQPQTHQILSAWQQPTYFVGRVLDIVDGFVIAEHYWTKEIVILVDVEIEDDIMNDFILCHIVPGYNERYYYLLSSAIILEKNHVAILEKWQQEFEASEYEQYTTFVNAYLLTCFEDLLGLKTITNSEIRDLDLDALQLIVDLDLLLLDLDVKNDRLAFVFFNYLMDHGMPRRLRNKDVLLGAIIDFGIRYDLLAKVITQKKLAELTKVSTSSIRRHSKKIAYYFEQDFDAHVFEKLRQPNYQIGTDARIEDYKEWQMTKHFEKMIFTNALDKKRMEKKMIGIPFKPISPQDNAQKYAYEAFLAETIEARQDFAKLSIMFDVTNEDAHIIQSERLTPAERLPVIQKLFVDNKQLSDLKNRNILLLVQLYFSQLQYEAAWILLSSVERHKRLQMKELEYFFIIMALYMKEEEQVIFEKVGKKLSEDGIMPWMKWMHAHVIGQEDEQQLLAEAIQSNPFVQKYIELGVAPAEYPTHKTCVKGDPGEAKIIHFILYPLLKDEF